MKKMLYWAYGSNLNVEHMARRCPRARKLRRMFVGDAALVFRGCADVVTRQNSTVPGGLWKITDRCEESLDRYEGVASRFYLKRYFHMTIDGKKEDVLFYQMRMSRGIMPPSRDYLETIVQGYKDFGLDLDVLDAFLQEAWGNKKVTEVLKERHVRKGSPRLAPISTLEGRCTGGQS